jgi:hypothetical protein
MRRCALAITLLVLAFAGSGSAAESQTQASVYEAFDAHGNVVGHLRTASGHCFTSSEVTSRDDAFRCLLGNALFDPSLRSPNGRAIVVWPIPGNESGTEIRLRSPLPAQSSHTPASLALQPWALETTSGARCLLAGGASSLIDGKRLNYFCGAGAKYGLWGYPSRHAKLWTIFEAPFSAHALQHRVAIARAWT